MPFQYIDRYSIRADAPCYGHEWVVRVLTQIPNSGTPETVYYCAREREDTVTELIMFVTEK